MNSNKQIRKISISKKKMQLFKKEDATKKDVNKNEDKSNSISYKDKCKNFQWDDAVTACGLLSSITGIAVTSYNII